MNSLGVLYKYGRGVERRDEQEVRYYRMSAKLGNAEAMFNLGTCYFEGNGVGIDDTRSSAWFFLSQQAGYANAGEAVKRFIDGKPPSREVEMIFAAARMYEEGVDVPTNRSAALTWYRKAADKGSAAAQVKVASLLIDQTALSSDYTEARQRCETAAKWKYSPGDVCLGVMYQRGLGVKQDPSEAVKWFLSGAELGNTAAMLHPATAYLEGNGVQPNRTTACMWTLIAFSLSPTEAQAQQAEVPGVSEQEMVAAKGQAAEWIKRHKSLVSKPPFQRSAR
jgi:TPR repeat protein